MEWFYGLETLAQIGLVLGALDIILGSMPDKYSLGWPGALLEVFHKLHQYGKDQK